MLFFVIVTILSIRSAILEERIFSNETTCEGLIGIRYYKIDECIQLSLTAVYSSEKVSVSGGGYRITTYEDLVVGGEWCKSKKNERDVQADSSCDNGKKYKLVTDSELVPVEWFGRGYYNDEAGCGYENMVKADLQEGACVNGFCQNVVPAFTYTKTVCENEHVSFLADVDKCDEGVRGCVYPDGTMYCCSDEKIANCTNGIVETATVCASGLGCNVAVDECKESAYDIILEKRDYNTTDCSTDAHRRTYFKINDCIHTELGSNYVSEKVKFVGGDTYQYIQYEDPLLGGDFCKSSVSSDSVLVNGVCYNGTIFSLVNDSVYIPEGWRGVGYYNDENNCLYGGLRKVELEKDDSCIEGVCQNVNPAFVFSKTMCENEFISFYPDVDNCEIGNRKCVYPDGTMYCCSAEKIANCTDGIVADAYTCPSSLGCNSVFDMCRHAPPAETVVERVMYNGTGCTDGVKMRTFYKIGECIHSSLTGTTYFAEDVIYLGTGNDYQITEYEDNILTGDWCGTSKKELTIDVDNGGSCQGSYYKYYLVNDTRYVDVGWSAKGFYNTAPLCSYSDLKKVELTKGDCEENACFNADPPFVYSKTVCENEFISFYPDIDACEVGTRGCVYSEGTMYCCSEEKLANCSGGVVVTAETCSSGFGCNTGIDVCRESPLTSIIEMVEYNESSNCTGPVFTKTYMKVGECMQEEIKDNEFVAADVTYIGNGYYQYTNYRDGLGGSWCQTQDGQKFQIKVDEGVQCQFDRKFYSVNESTLVPEGWTGMGFYNQDLLCDYSGLVKVELFSPHADVKGKGKGNKCETKTCQNQDPFWVFSKVLCENEHLSFHPDIDMCESGKRKCIYPDNTLYCCSEDKIANCSGGVVTSQTCSSGCSSSLDVCRLPPELSKAPVLEIVKYSDKNCTGEIEEYQYLEIGYCIHNSLTSVYVSEDVMYLGNINGNEYYEWAEYEDDLLGWDWCKTVKSSKVLVADDGATCQKSKMRVSLVNDTRYVPMNFTGIGYFNGNPTTCQHTDLKKVVLMKGGDDCVEVACQNVDPALVFTRTRCENEHISFYSDVDKCSVGERKCVYPDGYSYCCSLSKVVNCTGGLVASAKTCEFGCNLHFDECRVEDDRILEQIEYKNKSTCEGEIVSKSYFKIGPCLHHELSTNYISEDYVHMSGSQFRKTEYKDSFIGGDFCKTADKTTDFNVNNGSTCQDGSRWSFVDDSIYVDVDWKGVGYYNDGGDQCSHDDLMKVIMTPDGSCSDLACLRPSMVYTKTLCENEHVSFFGDIDKCNATYRKCVYPDGYMYCCDSERIANCSVGRVTSPKVCPDLIGCDQSSRTCKVKPPVYGSVIMELEYANSPASCTGAVTKRRYYKMETCIRKSRTINYKSEKVVHVTDDTFKFYQYEDSLIGGDWCETVDSEVTLAVDQGGTCQNGGKKYYIINDTQIIPLGWTGQGFFNADSGCTSAEMVKCIHEADADCEDDSVFNQCQNASPPFVFTLKKCENSYLTFGTETPACSVGKRECVYSDDHLYCCNTTSMAQCVGGYVDSVQICTECDDDRCTYPPGACDDDRACSPDGAFCCNSDKLAQCDGGKIKASTTCSRGCYDNECVPDPSSCYGGADCPVDKKKWCCNSTFLAECTKVDHIIRSKEKCPKGCFDDKCYKKSSSNAVGWVIGGSVGAAVFICVVATIIITVVLVVVGTLVYYLVMKRRRIVMAADTLNVKVEPSKVTNDEVGGKDVELGEKKIEQNVELEEKGETDDAKGKEEITDQAVEEEKEIKSE